MDIDGWLGGIGLKQYAQTFRDNAIDADVLRDLTDEHLRELGLPLGARLKLLRAVAALGTSEQTLASPEITPPAPRTDAERGWPATPIAATLCAHQRPPKKLPITPTHFPTFLVFTHWLPNKQQIASTGQWCYNLLSRLFGATSSWPNKKFAHLYVAPEAKSAPANLCPPARAAIHHVVALTRYPSSIHMRVSVAMLRSLQR